MAVNGVITSKEIFRNTLTIVREFGPRTYLRCCAAMVTGRRTTFLACVFALRAFAREASARYEHPSLGGST